MTEQVRCSHHDLLIRIDERMERVMNMLEGRDGESGLLKRVSSLEADRYKAHGAIAAAGASGGFFSWLIQHFFTK